MRTWLKNNRGFLALLLGMGLLRTAVADWNPVPTGSMRPTILEGDVVLVDRLAYDLKLPLTHVVLARLGEPQRGDVVTFDSPRDGTRLIKRLVALPGDQVELRAGHLLINGQEQGYSDAHEVMEAVQPGVTWPALRAQEHLAGRPHAVQYLGGGGHGRDFGPVTVPAEHYFMMGDNRDNSEDSRFIGSVPREMLIGRATHTLVSADILGDWRPRFERFAAPMQ
ncbi:signal peptidase I [Ideonella sp. 4Y11]|uniref:Signal peptidase I n=1 Tax=Ideonella aquatica TaxID=2824119 RepID=A0A940YDP3_9BURK|nr:signal peptidase I [Ideonella aquatica]MBQ0958250.1 signal peptidase I [Ideonella aquatica]